MQILKNDQPRLDRLQVSVEIDGLEQGGFVARCPELGLVVKKGDKMQAGKEIESLIMYCLTASEEFGISKGLVAKIESREAFPIKKFVKLTYH